MNHAPLTDPRDMRAAIMRLSRGEIALSGGAGYTPILDSAILARQAMCSADVRGLSGEDAMTTLAYHALRRVEELSAALVHRASTELPIRIIPNAPVSTTSFEADGGRRIG